MPGDGGGRGQGAGWWRRLTGSLWGPRSLRCLWDAEGKLSSGQMGVWV